MSEVKAAFADYYKAERNRSEDCLGDILKILEADSTLESEQVEQILVRLIKHYQRT